MSGFDKKMLVTAFAGGLACIGASQVDAAVINLNLGEDATAQETIGGDVWNNIPLAGDATGTMDNSDGSAATGVAVSAVTFGGGAPAGSGNNPADVGGANFGGSATLDSMTTSVFFAYGGATTTTIDFTVSGLAASTAYGVTAWIGLSNVTDTFVDSLTVNGAAVSGITALSNHAPGALIQLNATTTGAGDLVFSVAGGSDNVPLIQGVSVDTNLIPEPASMALMGLGGGLMLLRRRRDA